MMDKQSFFKKLAQDIQKDKEYYKIDKIRQEKLCDFYEQYNYATFLFESGEKNVGRYPRFALQEIPETSFNFLDPLDFDNMKDVIKDIEARIKEIIQENTKNYISYQVKTSDDYRIERYGSHPSDTELKDYKLIYEPILIYLADEKIALFKYLKISVIPIISAIFYRVSSEIHADPEYKKYVNQFRDLHKLGGMPRKSTDAYFFDLISFLKQKISLEEFLIRNEGTYHGVRDQ